MSTEVGMERSRQWLLGTRRGGVTGNIARVTKVVTDLCRVDVD
jgi:hypothetical protein